MKRFIPLPNNEPETINKLVDDIYENLVEVNNKIKPVGEFSKQQFYDASDAEKIIMIAQYLKVY